MLMLKCKKYEEYMEYQIIILNKDFTEKNKKQQHTIRVICPP